MHETFFVALGPSTAVAQRVVFINSGGARKNNMLGKNVRGTPRAS